MKDLGYTAIVLHYHLFIIVCADILGMYEYPTNIASVNLVISCNKVLLHYSKTCVGVLTL